MASFASPRYLLAFFLLNFYFLSSLAAEKNSTLGVGVHYDVAYGDCKWPRTGEIAGSRAFSAGRLMIKEPISLVDRKSGNLVSFSTWFVFSMAKENGSKENGDGLAFVMLPAGFNLSKFDGGYMGLLKNMSMKYLAIEFDTHKDDKYGDLNGNHVGVNVNGPVSVKSSNVSSLKLVLNSGVRFSAWIDYEASSKRFEVRLAKGGKDKPVDPLLTYSIDLSKMWIGENVTVGWSSSSRNSTQKSFMWMYTFVNRTVPHSMHSEPMDPDYFAAKGKEISVPRKSDCAFKIAAALIFGTGCGALGAFLVLFVWTIFGSRRPVAPEAFPVELKECECEKIGVDVEKAVEDGKK